MCIRDRASDTFAYFVGCAIGKRKLCPNVSPNKSVEGAAAGFIGCLAVMVYFLFKKRPHRKDETAFLFIIQDWSLSEKSLFPFLIILQSGL